MIDDEDHEAAERVKTDVDANVVRATEPFDTFENLSGYSKTKTDLVKKVTKPAQYECFGTASALLFGQSDQTPLTDLAKALTGEFTDEYSYFYVESVSGCFTDEDSNIKTTLEAARDAQPSVVVLDCLNEFSFDDEEYTVLRHHLEAIRTSDGQVLIVGTATEEDSELIANNELFEVVIEVPEPGEEYRQSELTSLLTQAETAGIATLPAEANSMSSELETRDLSGLELQTAVKRAIHELRETNPDLPVTVHPSNIQSTIDDIAADKFEASSESGFFGQGSDDERFEPDIPAISFGDIGGLEAEKHRLREAVTIPVKYNQTFRDAGYSVGQGILLHGPPGNGKTMLAKAVANELDYHFLSVKGPELEQPFVGESERQVRELFKAAHEHVPSVIFFDEFDSLAPDRATDTSVYKDDLVNTLLSELDGLEPLEDVIVMAATNRLDRLDPAVLRSGRFDTFIEIPKPDRDDQQAIFELHTTNIPLDESVSADWFGTLNLPELSGADIETICRKALEFAVTAFDAGNRDVLVVTRSDIRTASDQLRADTTRDDLPEFR